MPPTARDEKRANRLILSSSDGAEGQSAILPEPLGDPPTRPTKRLRKDFAPTEAEVAQFPPAPAATPIEGSALPATQAVRRKRRQKVGSQGPRGATDTPEAEIINLDEGSSEREEEAALQPIETEAEVPIGDALVETGASLRDVRASGATEPTRRSGKEPATEGESDTQDWDWPFPHRVDEIDAPTWDRLRLLLVGTAKTGPRYEREPSVENRHEPECHLDKRASVLESRIAQSKAVE